MARSVNADMHYVVGVGRGHCSAVSGLSEKGRDI